MPPRALPRTFFNNRESPTGLFPNPRSGPANLLTRQAASPLAPRLSSGEPNQSDSGSSLREARPPDCCARRSVRPKWATDCSSRYQDCSPARSAVRSGGAARPRTSTLGDGLIPWRPARPRSSECQVRPSCGRGSKRRYPDVSRSRSCRTDVGGGYAGCVAARTGEAIP
jgi:hypothetical protein